MFLAQGNKAPTRPRIEPGSPDPESDALTTRPVCPHQFGSPVLKTRYTMYSLGANHPVRLYSLSALL